MARELKSRSIAIIAGQRAEDAIWGIPESPEFSAVQRLMNEFQSHVTQEEQSLSSYREIAKETIDSQVRFLLGLIVADEEKHHELTARMIAKLKDELAWTRSTGMAPSAGESGERARRLLASVESFLAGERTALENYARLKKQSRGLYREMFALLYTTMIHDSRKHIDILNFLRARLKDKRRDARKRHG